MSRRRHDRGEPAIGLLESAFHLLRGTPASLWLWYYLGTVPWVLVLLAYGAEMLGPGRSAVEGALLLALGYPVMKAGQSIFARGLLAGMGASALDVHGTAARPEAAANSTIVSRWRQWLQALSRQAALQPWSLLALPIAFVIGLPFGWAYAYFQSFLVLGEHRAARRQAALWPRQNHLALVLLAAIALCVFLNAAVAIIALPGLFSALFGIDSAAARNPWGLVSWTTAALAAALSYLATGPLAKAVYALRCFHGESRHTGADLHTELRSRRGPGGGPGQVAAAVALLALMAAVAMAQGRAAEPMAVASNGATEASAGGADELDRALDRVLARPEFAWRLPREERPEGAERGFLGMMVATFSRWTRAALDGLDQLTSWLRGWWRPATGARGQSGLGWIGSTYLWLGLLAAAVLVAAVLLYRRRRAPEPSEAVAAMPVALDPLADAGAAASAAPEEWLARADELLRAGDSRHAVRAFYLASLSLLAHRELLQPERSKSNHDYLLELRRRARERPQLGELFAACSEAFERVWYGHHPASAELVSWFRAQHGQLAAHAS